MPSSLVRAVLKGILTWDIELYGGGSVRTKVLYKQDRYFCRQRYENRKIKRTRNSNTEDSLYLLIVNVTLGIWTSAQWNSRPTPTCAVVAMASWDIRFTKHRETNILFVLIKKFDIDIRKLH